jgi:bifunctional DNase/RNase
VESERFLPIWVGPYEAEAITVALQEIEMIRPLTHDLLKSVIAQFGARIERVEIVALREDIFFGNIVAETEDGRTLNIDSRPSDAIALAVRAHVPIMVHQSVMDSAGITPEQDLATQVPPKTAMSAASQAALQDKSSAAQPAAEKDDRLSIFEDFLSGLGTDVPPKEDEDPDKPQTQ